MAKSLRSKTKRNFRRVKRDSGVYAVADAARLQRLSSKLHQKIGTDQDGDVAIDEIVEGVGNSDETGEASESVMVVSTEETNAVNPGVSQTSKISTSGPRSSGRETWRISKGLAPQRKDPNKVNRLGVVVAKRRAGRSKRRR